MTHLDSYFKKKPKVDTINLHYKVRNVADVLQV